MKLGKVLVSCLSFLLPMLGAGAFPVSALSTPNIMATNVNHVVISDVDVEFVTDSGPQTFRMTGSFTLPDATITTADPVYSGTCIPASGTSSSQNMQSCSLTPRVNGVNTTYGHHASTLTYDDSDVSLTLTSSGSTNVITKIYYQKSQTIYAILDSYASGQYWFPFVPADGWSFNSFIYEPLDNSSTVSWYTLDGVQGVRVTVSNSNVVGFKIRRVFENQTSINTSVLGTCNVWNGKWLNVTASEFPVSDSSSHELLNSVLQALNGSGGSQSAVDSANQNVNSSVSGLSSQGNQMHNVENNVMNSMDTALQSQDLQTDVVSEIRGNNNLNASLSWVSNQVTRIISGFNDITPMWEFMFVMPLVIGIGLVIIGRLR